MNFPIAAKRTNSALAPTDNGVMSTQFRTGLGHAPTVDESNRKDAE